MLAAEAAEIVKVLGFFQRAADGFTLLLVPKIEGIGDAQKRAQLAHDILVVGDNWLNPRCFWLGWALR